MFFSALAALAGALLQEGSASPPCSAARGNSASPRIVTPNTSTLESKNGSYYQGCIKLQSDGSKPDIVVIDHGLEVAGYPTFDVACTSGNTSVFEITYSETWDLLSEYMGDGPYTLAAAGDTYRVNRYNVLHAQQYTNRLIQGGQRYQKLNLSSAGELKLRYVGVISSVATTPPTQLSGSFECSNNDYNQIWQAGVRTLQLTDIAANSTPDFYQISEEGLLAESQSPQPYTSLASGALSQYSLEFKVKPVTGGFGFTVLSDTLGSGVYIFVDVNTSFMSANLGSTERDSAAIASTTFSSPIELGAWHHVMAQVNGSDIGVVVDGVSLFNFSQAVAFVGSFGLGASLGHTAYYQNVTLSSLTGSLIYNSTLTDRAVLADFVSSNNPEAVSVDGARRDRIAYAGDLDITIPTAAAIDSGLHYVNGTINLLASNQLLPGFFIPNVKIQQAPRIGIIPFNVTGLIGYSFNLVTTMCEFYDLTADDAFARRWSGPVTKMLDWADSQLSSTGLFNISNAAFGGDWNYYDPPQTGGVAKFNALYAFALKRSLPLLDAAGVNTTTYSARFTDLQTAMNTHLYNPVLNAYQLSDSNSNVLSQDANAFAILAGVPSGNISASAILSTLRNQLFVPAGALAFSNSSVASGFAPQVLELDWAQGTHPTIRGNMDVAWRFDAGGLFAVNLTAPIGTTGVVTVPRSLRRNSMLWSVNGATVLGSSFNVTGGPKFMLQQLA
ncbi:hypothetical protein V500_03299 [Pseudogymnoascus sp. VKM F-4518 (FW-2643)]|nr:hypothetical protein V500_03299 [Pseudogymnoascus sp. VKM F-4518 (FW-2643)]